MDKSKLYPLTGPLRRLIPFSILVRISRQKMLFPFWHAVAPVPPPHIRHLYPVPSPEQFRRDMEWLLRHFKPIGLPDAVRYITGEASPEKPVMHITIDDGFRESVEVIAPMLKELGVPATFFVSPAFVGNHDMSYRCKASLVYHQLLRPGLPECIPSGITKAFMKKGLPVSDFRKAVFTIPYRHREMLDHLGLVAGINFEEYLREQKPYMDDAQIRSLQADGFYIGAHSVDHPWYPDLSPGEQLQQTLQSTDFVRNLLGEMLPVFAFPFADHFLPLEFYRNLHAMPHAPLVTFGTSGLKKDSAPRSAQRVAMEQPSVNVPGIVFSEYLYFLFKALAGKNLLRRAENY